LLGDPVTNGRITDVGVNQMILERSVPLFATIVEYASRALKKTYLLTRGLKETPTKVRAFDAQWYLEHVIQGYRKVLQQYPIVETNSGKQLLFAADSQPFIKFVVADDKHQTLYHLYRDVFPHSRFPIESENRFWCAAIWKECGIQKVENLCEHIVKFAAIDSVPWENPLRFRTNITWLNAFYKFIRDTKQDEVFGRYPIVLNVLGRFVLYRPTESAQAPDVSQSALDCLRDLGNDWRPRLIDCRITALVIRQWKPQDASQAIRQRISEAEQKHADNETAFFQSTWPLLRILPKDVAEKSRETHEQLQKFALELIPALKDPIKGDGILDFVWRESHPFAVCCLIRYVAKFRNIREIRTLTGTVRTLEDRIAWMNRFLPFAKANTTGQLDLANHAIVPNRLGDFCPIGQISLDTIDDWFKSRLFESFGVDLNSQLLYPGVKMELPARINIAWISRALGAFTDGILKGVKDFDPEGKRAIANLRVPLLRMHALPLETDGNYQKFRRLLDVLRIVFSAEVTEMRPGSIRDHARFITADHIHAVLRLLLDKIAALACCTRIPPEWDRNPVLFLNSLYLAVEPFFTEKPYADLARMPIYPDNGGNFRPIAHLSKGKEFNPQFVQALQELCGRDLNAELILDGIDPRRKIVFIQNEELWEELQAGIVQAYEEGEEKRGIARRYIMTVFETYVGDHPNYTQMVAVFRQFFGSSDKRFPALTSGMCDVFVVEWSSRLTNELLAELEKAGSMDKLQLRDPQNPVTFLNTLYLVMSQFPSLSPSAADRPIYPNRQLKFCPLRDLASPKELSPDLIRLVNRIARVAESAGLFESLILDGIQPRQRSGIREIPEATVLTWVDAETGRYIQQVAAARGFAGRPATSPSAAGPAGISCSSKSLITEGRISGSLPNLPPA
jgi:hypothetical protein